MEQTLKKNAQETLTEIDQALAADRQTAPAPRGGRGLPLPALLRLGGAIVLIAASVTFLLQHWEKMDHVLRYLSFLGFTAGLAVAGVFCVRRLQDDKSARTFLAVAAAIVPVHFCQLGALLYSRFGSVEGSYYSFLRWTAPSDISALTVTVAGLAVLAPIVFIAFTVLARSTARQAALSFLAFNAVLLIPSRAPDLSGLMLLGLLAATAAVDVKVLRNQTAMKTLEGRLVRAMLAVPLILLAARMLSMYQVTIFFHSMVAAATAILLFVVAPYYTQNRKQAEICQVASTVPALIAWALLVADINQTLRFAAVYWIPLVTLPYAGILLLMSFNAVSGGADFRRSAGVVALLGSLGQLSEFPSVFSSLLCVAVGLLTGAAAYQARAKTFFGFSVVTFGAGLLYHVHYAVELYSYSPWLSLALLGAGTILSATYVEKHKGLFIRKWNDRAGVRNG